MSTAFGFSLEAMQKILKRLEAAEKMAAALKEVTPLLVGIGTQETEQRALEALADWEMVR